MKKLFIIFLLFFSFSNCAFCATEAPEKKITLQEAIDIAMRENVDLQSARLDVNIAKNNIKISNRLQNPSLDMNFNTGVSGKGEPHQLGITELVEIGKRGVRKQLAKNNYELAVESCRLSEFYVKMDVRRAYIELVEAKSVYNVVQEQKKLLEELDRIAKQRGKSGKAQQVDVMQVEMALNHLITQSNSARANIQAAKYKFNKSLNLRDTNVIFESEDDLLEESENFIDLNTPQPKDKMPPFQTISDLTAEKRFDLKVAKYQVESAKKELILAGRQRIPDIEVSAGYLYSPKNHTENREYEGGAYIGGSIVNLPLLYSYSPEIKNAKLKLEQAVLNYESVENIATNDLKIKYSKFMTAKLNLNYYNKTMLKQSQDFIKIAKSKYEKGEIDITSLVVMEDSYRDIQTGYVQALSEYYTSWIDFLREVNDENFNLIQVETL